MTDDIEEKVNDVHGNETLEAENEIQVNQILVHEIPVSSDQVCFFCLEKTYDNEIVLHFVKLSCDNSFCVHILILVFG